MIDSFQNTEKTAVILGCAKCVYSDYDLIQEKELVHFGVNDISFQFSKAPIQHVVSLHSDMVLSMKRLNKVRYNQSCTSHSLKSDDGVDCVWFNHISNIGGTSSLFAVEIALLMGFRKIIVCGVPLDSSPHYYEDLSKEVTEVYDFGRIPEASIWKQKIDSYKKKFDFDIKVASGQLSHIFGGLNG